jgi:kumamolisin
MAQSNSTDQSHSVVVGSERYLRSGAKQIGAADGKIEIEATLKLRRKKALPEFSSRPAVPMTRQQLAAKHGASSADLTKVITTLGKYGLKRVSADPATRTVRLRGTIADMEKAFAVKLFNYQHGSEQYRGRVGPVHVPTSLKSIVQAVFGLDNRRMVHHRRQPVRPIAQDTAMAGSSFLIPSELASHYNFPPGDGSGQAVGLLEFGGGYFENDLKHFCTMAKVPGLPQVVTVSTDGTPTNSNDPADGEVMLDVEVVAGACPKAKIVVYFAHFTEQGWVTILDAAIHDAKNDPGVLSVSWGFAEDKLIWTQQAMTQINESLKEAAAIGVTVCIASGDDGSCGAVTDDGHAHVNFPASSPYVLAVGGTTVTGKGVNQPDIVWKEGSGIRATNGGSTGGGVSAQFPRPSWQKSVKIKSVNPGAMLGRCLPDIAANADWNASPYLLVVNGSAQPNGGTSAATPLLASLLTRINEKRPPKKRVGYVTPILYKGRGTGATIGASGCTDVLKGNNTTARVGGYAAEKGYDAVSGWGTPDGQKLAKVL